MNENYDQAGLLNGAANLQDYGLTERQILAAQAQTAATLALAYEQRTANLIAFERSQWEAWRRDELTDEGAALWENVAGQVKERLGLA